jgi:hypothetical protein
MIVCRNCGWLGVNEDRRWGACPACQGRKFADSVELWADKLIWVALITVLAYVMSSPTLG